MGYSDTYAAIVDSTKKVEGKNSIDVCDKQSVFDHSETDEN
jgi:hypothetical protein